MDNQTFCAHVADLVRLFQRGIVTWNDLSWHVRGLSGELMEVLPEEQTQAMITLMMRSKGRDDPRLFEVRTILDAL